MSKPCLSWTMTRGQDRSFDQIAGTRIILGLRDLFQQKGLGLPSQPEEVLSAECGYRIRWSLTSGLDELHQIHLTGGGELGSSCSIGPVLFLGLLAKEINSAKIGRTVILCDERGNHVDLQHWNDIKAELIRLGVASEEDADDARKLAEQIGLVTAFTLCVEDEEDAQFYF